MFEERRSNAQNRRQDVVAMLDASGGLVEQVRYSRYGVPYGLPAGDTDSDGDFDSADVSAITGSYDVRKDANLDGSIDINDITHAANMAGGGGFVTTGRDVLGSVANANRFGYGAYLRDPAVPQWHVRLRVLRSDMGRWLTRDPAGYVDGWNLYEYVHSWAVLGIDPDGRQMMPVQPDGGGGRSPQPDVPSPQPAPLTPPAAAPTTPASPTAPVDEDFFDPIWFNTTGITLCMWGGLLVCSDDPGSNAAGAAMHVLASG